MLRRSLLGHALALSTLGASVLLAGCPREGAITLAEARDALAEAALASDAENLVTSSVELTTDFTIGGALEAAAEEIRAFVEAQLPCAEVVVSGASLRVTYGAKPGNCSYRGHTYSGTHTIAVSKAEPGEILVQHEWEAFSNGRVEVSGQADVTWSLDAGSRRVVHELEWTRLSDGKSATGSGDRTQSPLGGDWASGVVVDGERAWSGSAGDWDLQIDGVEARWADPVPQSGAYVLLTPKGRQLTLSFRRLDEDRIEVTLEGGGREFRFSVGRLGVITTLDDGGSAGSDDDDD